FTFLEFTSLLIKFSFQVFRGFLPTGFGVAASTGRRPVSMEVYQPAESAKLSSSKFPIHRGESIVRVFARCNLQVFSSRTRNTASCRLATPTSGESTVGCWPI
ncbi:hypothetical protein M5D96_014121, partial [Drosophila gunungcola]